MKLKKWMYGALALGLFGACSNDDVPSGGGTTQVADGYFAVNLQLPTQQGTRAGNDNYDDGSVNEYTVSNAAIVIFKGTPDASKTSYENERAATFVGAYSLYDLDPATPDVDNDNITTQYSKVAKVNSFETEATDKLYALALLNYDEAVIAIDETGNKLKVKGADFNGTFGDLMEIETNHNLFNGESTDADKFFMTNAPLSNTPGSPTRGTLAAPVPAIGNVQVLATFDKDKIAESEAEARQSPATSIYVERAVAKATLESVPGKAHIGKTDFDILFWGWYVDNTEKTSYIVRNLGIGSGEGLLTDYLGYTTGGEYAAYQNHRFVGAIPMGNIPGNGPTAGTPDNPLLYRIYWCKDPNYNNLNAEYNTVFLEEDFSEFTEEQRKAKEEELNGYFENKDYIFYPHENTFNVANQNFHNTTRAVFRMTIGADKDGVAKTFYTRNGDENILYTSAKDATSVIEAFLTGVDPTSGTTTPGQTVDPGNATTPEPNNVAGYNTDIREAFKKALNKDKSFTYGTDNISVTYKTDETGCYKVANIDLVVSESLIGEGNVFAVNPNTAFQTSATKEALINYLNNTWKILEYKDGHSYYDLRFMHFADEVVEGSNDTFSYGDGELAPWKWAVTKTDETKVNTNEAYGDNEPYYLGRYGMVRNNWYSLSIGAVRHLGTPVPPKVQNVETSDDNKEVEKYIAVNVKVKAWAKRTQKHNF